VTADPIRGVRVVEEITSQSRSWLNAARLADVLPLSPAGAFIERGVSMSRRELLAILVVFGLGPSGAWADETRAPRAAAADRSATERPTEYKTVEVEGVEIFYREAGPKEAPTILLLHGFPTSSHMFRNLIPALADRFHMVAPDYPGFGNSAQPSMERFDYTFDRLALVVDKFSEKLGLGRYSLYLMDYGAPIGFRLASKHPERVDALIVQNGNAYDEGLREFWVPIKKYWSERSAANAEPLEAFITPEGVRWQYTHGVRDVARISPDNWNVDLRHLTREGNPAIQLALFHSYGSNPPLYPQWQEYLRQHQPPTLIVWGKNDHIFPEAGAHPYKRDLKRVELHLLDTGHFALEEDGTTIAALIRSFLDRNLRRAAS
jgi:pimeloyl-ACP methyl ester carboxylesterase